MKHIFNFTSDSADCIQMNQNLIDCNLDELSIHYDNVMDNQYMFEKYNITSTPTLVLLENGSPIKSLVGVHTSQQIRDWANS